MDEIYVKPKLSYVGNKIEGFSKNSEIKSTATTVQVYMITSICSKNKDVVGLYPVKNLNAEYLYKVTNNILRIIHMAGYETVSIISDNNQVNRKLFQKFSPTNGLQPYIISPFDANKKLFLLFDTVHLIKNIRNNWLNEKLQTFIFPSLSADVPQRTAKFSDLKYIHENEMHSSIKLAPRLSYKTIYPNSFERQNVSLALNVFDEKNVEALKYFEFDLGSESAGTVEFISTIKNWWSTVNVKSPSKGIHQRNEFAMPIKDASQMNVQYLITFLHWLQDWDDLISTDKVSKHVGKLSNPTMQALQHTTAGLMSIFT